MYAIDAVIFCWSSPFNIIFRKYHLFWYLITLIQLKTFPRYSLSLDCCCRTTYTSFINKLQKFIIKYAREGIRIRPMNIMLVLYNVSIWCISCTDFPFIFNENVNNIHSSKLKRIFLIVIVRLSVSVYIYSFSQRYFLIKKDEYFCNMFE